MHFLNSILEQRIFLVVILLSLYHQKCCDEDSPSKTRCDHSIPKSQGKQTSRLSEKKLPRNAEFLTRLHSKLIADESFSFWLQLFVILARGSHMNQRKLNLKQLLLSGNDKDTHDNDIRGKENRNE
jgi:hypothetical protein